MVELVDERVVHFYSGEISYPEMQRAFSQRLKSDGFILLNSGNRRTSYNLIGKERGNESFVELRDLDGLTPLKIISPSEHVLRAKSSVERVLQVQLKEIKYPYRVKP
jgi:hypothetical protein